MRHAPSPPVTKAVRSRVLSIKTSLSCPPPVAGPIVPPYVPGFDPLPTYLRDWQPSSRPYAMSDDEDSLSDPGVTAWKNQRKVLHPGVSDLDLRVVFSKKQPFFDVWDLPDDIYIAVPARLHLSLKNFQQWKVLPSEPNLRYIDIRCNTFDYRPLSHYFPPEYSVCYHGASSTEYADPNIVPADLTRGIIVNKRWHKTYPESSVHHFRESLITNYGRLPDDSIQAPDEDDEESISKEGWFFKFMVPIPSWVLRQGNTRAFTVEASTWVGGLDQGGLIRGESELVISHLRSEREMLKGRGTHCI